MYSQEDGKCRELQFGKLPDQIADAIGETLERWNNRLVFPFSKLRKRYITGQLYLYFRCKMVGKSFLIHVRGTNNESGQDALGDGYAHIEGTDDENNLVMLINSVEFMNNGMRIIERN